MDFVFPHLLTFLLGALSGASALYLGTKYTEKRHALEKEKNSRKQFLKAKSMMPELISEMRNDILNDDSKSVRELMIVPSKRLPLNTTKPRFVYYEDEHENLKGKTDILENNGYIYEVTVGNVPIYRFSEEFFDLLQRFGD